jgi:branched-subunit amino acid permease
VRKNTKARLLPIVIFPAIMPAILLPAMLSHHVSDHVLGATMGFCIGLAIVGLVWMVKSNSDCSKGPGVK